MKTFLLLILILLNLSAKDNTYCFESPYLFSGENHVRELSLTFDDENLSEEYQIDVPLYYTLDNGKTYISDPPNCYYENSNSPFASNKIKN